LVELLPSFHCRTKSTWYGIGVFLSKLPAYTDSIATNSSIPAIQIFMMVVIFHLHEYLNGFGAVKLQWSISWPGFVKPGRETFLTD